MIICLFVLSVVLVNGKWVLLGVGMIIRFMLGLLNRCFGLEIIVIVG